MMHSMRHASRWSVKWLNSALRMERHLSAEIERRVAEGWLGPE